MFTHRQVQVSSVIILLMSAFMLMNRSIHAMTISEVLPQPSTLQTTEWVELWNDSQTPVDISSWIIKDHLSTSSVIHVIPEGTVLAGGGYWVAQVTNKLNNSADGVSLFDPAGQLIDIVSYTSSQPDQSWSRLTPTTSELLLTNPSPGTTNQFPTPTPSPSPSPTPLPSLSPTPSPNATATPSAALAPLLTEVMSCPLSGELEWIELYNPHASALNLQDWRIVDAAGQTRNLLGSIAPGEYLTHSWSSALLNNSGDSFTLQDPLGAARQQVALPDCQAGVSFSLIDNVWRPTTPTLGAVNGAVLGTVVSSQAAEPSPSPKFTTNPFDSSSLSPTTSNQTETLPAAVTTQNQLLSENTTELTAATHNRSAKQLSQQVFWAKADNEVTLLEILGLVGGGLLTLPAGFVGSLRFARRLTAVLSSQATLHLKSQLLAMIQ
jgi:hypothetical protein